jgi:hypothetical protein
VGWSAHVGRRDGAGWCGVVRGGAQSPSASRFSA